MRGTQTDNALKTAERADALPGMVPAGPYALIVDDDEAILSVVMLLLEMENYLGLGFSDSTKVLPFLEQVGREHPPAVILLDLMMPTISGYEIAARLAQHEHYAHIPIVIMTADNRVRSTSKVPGAVDLLNKPFQMTTLLTKLERYLSPPTI